MVGLPGAGKTTRALWLESEHHAVRLTPDDWIRALFGELRDGEARDRLEGMLLDLAVPVLRGGLHVIVDFGLWSRDERTALRWVADELGVPCRVEHLRHHDEDRHPVFEPPRPDELSDGALDPVPQGWETWGHWAAGRWPGLRVVLGGA